MTEERHRHLLARILAAVAVAVLVGLALWLGLVVGQGPPAGRPLPPGTLGRDDRSEDGGLFILDGPRIRRRGEGYVIEWTTSRPTDAVVRFGKGDRFGQVAAKGQAFVKQHRVQLPSIPYIWLYDFWVVSSDRYRHEVSTTFGPEKWSTGRALVDASGDYPLLCESPSPGSWVDLDGDGDQDVLLVGAEEEGRRARLLCREDGGYRDCSSRVRLGPLSGTITTADWADFDGDGYPDLLACCQGVVVCQNYGPPAYGLGRSTTLIGPEQDTPAVQAFFIHANDDDLPDVAVLRGNGELWVFRNQGSPLPHFERARDLEPSTLSAPPAETQRGMIRADFTGDGRRDLLMMGGGSVLESTPDGLARAEFSVRPPEEHHLMQAAAADFDGDGDADLYAVFAKESGRAATSQLLQNTGTGFEDVTAGAGELEAFGSEVSSAAWMDLTGDGAPDLVLGTRLGEVEILLGDGSGVFTVATEALGLEVDRDERVQHISGADVTGDGQTDLFVTCSAGPAMLYRNRFAEWAPRRLVRPARSGAGGS